METTKRFISLLLLLAGAQLATAEVYQLTSPSGNIRMDITIDDSIHFSAWTGNEKMVEDAALSLNVGKEVLGRHPKVRKVQRRTIDEQILAALSRKDRTQESLIAAVKAQID